MKKIYLKKLSLLAVAFVSAFLLQVYTGEESKKAENNVSNVSVSESVTTETFSYIHDPRDNPKAMEDIVENPDAVYGFSPDPESTRLGPYADACDWTDPEVVAQNKANRQAYEEGFDSMLELLRTMRDEGKSIEEMARAVSEARNKNRLESYNGDPAGLVRVKKSNLDTYGNENGPTPEYLYEKYGSWELVIQHAFSMNMGMDACCGLYDENYELYQELGLVEE